MKEELTIRQTESTLPAPMRNELRIIKNSPAPYYAELRQEKISDPRPSNVPSLGQIQRENGFTNALAVLTFAINELKEWFNVKNNITPEQAAMTAELILDYPPFADLSLGNIKACFRQRMMTEKLYDRLDGNIIISWLREFKSQMAEAIYTQHLNQDKTQEAQGNSYGVSLNDYTSMLEQRAADGDLTAQEALNRHREWIENFTTRTDKKMTTREKELAFFKYKQNYLKNKTKQP